MADPPDDAPRRRFDDRGVSILEFAGFLPFLLVIGMAAIQLGLVGYGANQAGSAARAAARAESLNPGTGQSAAAAAASGWLNPSATIGSGSTVTATVTVHVNAIIPLFDGWDLTRQATMPNDERNDGS
ncbi:pilus assembly protein [Streptomyces kunmingensis]|uniref:Pilus assembly protein n=1 Tax=Streptomyces kunmingensis TaxID=68225 RepID=A0ABU6CI46_9ACTN|nr:TadE family protein [Streptomyces kunmingensis]MEB3964050.1 pilus assembly protein [Streptomyces kunmingensis]